MPAKLKEWTNGSTKSKRKFDHDAAALCEYLLKACKSAGTLKDLQVIKTILRRNTFTGKVILQIRNKVIYCNFIRPQMLNIKDFPAPV